MELNLFKNNDGNKQKHISELSQSEIVEFYLDTFIELNEGLANVMYLKGNILLNKIAPNHARTTNDLDFSVINLELYQDILIPRLNKFGETILCKDTNATSFTIKELTKTRSGGISIKNSNGDILYSIDISLGNFSIFDYKTYSFSGKYVQDYTINKIIADKCLSTLSRAKFRRIKDFYDLYVICTNNIEYDIIIVKQLMIDKTDEHTFLGLLDNFPFTLEILLELTKIWDTKFSLKTQSENYEKPPFSEILTTISCIYERLK